MSLWIRDRPAPVRRESNLITADQLIPPRPGSANVPWANLRVTRDESLKHSAVFAAVRLRADLISTLPCEVYRTVNGIQVDVTKPPVLVAPGGEEWDYIDWMWASQFDMDLVGNAVGLITERDALGLPRRIELQPSQLVSVRKERKDTTHSWWINGKRYEPEQVWHEKQFPVPGFVLGLSPLAYAAWTLSESLSMQEFAIAWFSGGGVPKAHLHNTRRTLKPGEAEIIRERHEASIKTGTVLVTGNDWAYDMIQGQTAGQEFIEGRKLGMADIARFFGVPADLIEAAATSSGGRVNYANITQRNLQFLIYQLGPAVIKREAKLSRLLPRPRYVKLNTDAILRMDPETREKVIRSKLESHQLTVTEAREMDNRAPLTQAQTDEVMEHFPPKGGGGATQPANNQQPDTTGKEGAAQ